MFGVKLPAQTISPNSSYWHGAASYSYTQEDTAKTFYHDPENPIYKNWTFEHEPTEIITPGDIEASLKSLKTARERVAFLYDVLYSKAGHNRFFWAPEDLERTPVLLTATGLFDSMVKNAITAIRPPEVPIPTPESIIRKELSLLLNRGKLRRRYLYYTLMRIITRGKKRRHYGQKKREAKQRLKDAESIAEKYQL